MEQNNTKKKNPYFKVLGILIVPLLLITFYSFSEKIISFGDFILEKTDINKYFLADFGEANNGMNLTDSIAEEEQIVIVNDTASQRILFFGDSMVEGLSKRMRQYAAANGHELLNVIWYSSSTKVWSEYNDTLTHFINQFDPTYIMICLGGNELFVRDLDKREGYIQTIVKIIEKKPYVWIGPPNWKADTGINDLIEKHVETPRFFPSKNLKYERGKDGAHPTYASAAKWMDSIAVWMAKEPYYRIRMDFPENDTREGKTTILQPLK